MYDLTVDDAHTFAVGEGAWVVHNQLPCKVSRTENGSNISIRYSSYQEDRIAVFNYDTNTQILDMGLLHTRDTSGDLRFAGINGSGVLNDVLDNHMSGHSVNAVTYHSSLSRGNLDGNMRALIESLERQYDALNASGLPRNEWPDPDLATLVAEQTPLGTLLFDREFVNNQVVTYLSGSLSPQVITWDNFMNLQAINVVASK